MRISNNLIGLLDISGAQALRVFHCINKKFSKNNIFVVTIVPLRM